MTFFSSAAYLFETETLPPVFQSPEVLCLVEDFDLSIVSISKVHSLPSSDSDDFINDMFCRCSAVSESSKPIGGVRSSFKLAYSRPLVFVSLSLFPNI